MNATVLAGLALVVSAPALKEPPKKPHELTGEWVMESTTVAGTTRPAPGGELVYEFTKDEKWLIRRAEKELAAANRGYKADPKAETPTIDLMTDVTRPDVTRREGIYKIEGDTLTICLANVKQPRPTRFESTAGDRNLIYVLKRKKKD
ncbi:MAG TPA: TIGR03067 domain-containing protein [Gemmataceae bacterium]|nr:TIGR03067 domain-containing protein [Gemmataceae bacterium]